MRFPPSAFRLPPSAFSLLWSAQTISVFGTLITRNALPFTAILVLGATPLEVALIYAAEVVPGFLGGLAAGVWVDRLRRRPILIGADLGRAAILAVIPIAAILGVLSIPIVIGVAFLAGLLTVFFDVAFQSYLPTVVAPDRLVRANSRIAASSSVAEFGAFGIGGWLVQVLTGPIAILIDCFTFLVSALLIGGIRTKEEKPAAPDHEANAWREAKAGLAVVFGDHTLRRMLLSVLASVGASRIFGSVYLLFVTRELGFEPGVLGVIFAIGGVGALIGAVAAQRVVAGIGFGRALVWGWILVLVGDCFLFFAPSAGLVAALLLISHQLVADSGATVYQISEISVRQQRAPDAIRGRVNATFQFGQFGLELVGILLGGWLAELVGLRGTIAISILAGLLVLPSILFLRIPTLRTTAGSESGTGED